MGSGFHIDSWDFGRKGAAPSEDLRGGSWRGCFKFLNGSKKTGIKFKQDGLYPELRLSEEQGWGEGFGIKNGEVSIGILGGILPWKGGEALEWNSQSICGCSSPGIVHGQVGQGLEQPGRAEGLPAHGIP